MKSFALKVRTQKKKILNISDVICVILKILKRFIAFFNIYFISMINRRRIRDIFYRNKSVIVRALKVPKT